MKKERTAKSQTVPPEVVAEFEAQLDDDMDAWKAGVEKALRLQTQRGGKGGRKKYSELKQLGPEKTIEENLARSAMGEFATSAEGREIFDLVALWKLDYASAFKVYPDIKGALLNRQQRREWLIGRLLAIISPALEQLDPKPFVSFAKAIALAECLNHSGALLPDAHEVLRVVYAMDLKLGDEVIQSVSPTDFKAQLRRKIGERTFARIKKQIGLHFPTGRPKA